MSHGLECNELHFQRVISIQREIEDLIAKERLRQNMKWGEQNHNDYYWMSILLEEVGEASRELIENAVYAYPPVCVSSFPDRVNHIITQNIKTDRLEKELVQVAAVAVAWLEAIKCRVYNV